MKVPQWLRAVLLPAAAGVLLAASLLFGTGQARAAEIPKQLAVPSVPEGNQACLACHARDEKMVRGGHEISIQVDGQTYNDSVHGIISCVRCHTNATAEHAKDPKQPLTDKTGRDLRAEISQVCTKCHAGLYPQSYNASFHGVAVQNGDNRAATCVDCHGTHNIQPSRNPVSMVAPANLPQTCGTTGCHAGAPVNFANGKEHYLAADAIKAPTAVHWIYKFFMVLILFDTMKDGPVVMFELLRRLQNTRRK